MNSLGVANARLIAVGGTNAGRAFDDGGAADRARMAIRCRRCSHDASTAREITLLSDWINSLASCN